jgi:hypothetical protein
MSRRLYLFHVKNHNITKPILTNPILTYSYLSYPNFNQLNPLLYYLDKLYLENVIWKIKEIHKNYLSIYAFFILYKTVLGQI